MRTPIRRRTTGALAVLGATVLAAAATTALTTLPASAATSATVSINADRTLATVPTVGVGMNVAVWDGRMNDPETSQLLANAGVKLVRYPGGGYADGYHWQTHTVEGGGYVAANTEFDKYVATVKAAGAQPIITANYGSGTPQEAADWVRYANVTKGYGIKYWEIGNELYGNGHYGAQWETDKHTDKSPAAYANNLLSFITAMKAVDPTIKIGAVLTTPNNWPDGVIASGDTMDWNHTVMSIAGPKIDYVVVHHYPYSTTEAELLAKPQGEVPAMMSALRGLISQYAGANAVNVGIAVTEGNSQYAVDTSPAGLYAPDNYLTWLEQGAFTLDWWNLRNGSDCSKVTTIQGAADYNDGGVVSSGASCEPAANTPFAPYYGIQMMTKLFAGGDGLVQASSSTSLLSAHAVRRANGDLTVMLINKDPNNAVTASLSYSGFTPAAGTPTVYSYPKNATGITSAAMGSATTQVVAAYSIVVVQLHPGGGTSPSPSPSASASPSRSPSPSPSASPSPTTSPAGTGSCKISYVKSSEWAGGMVANVTVANTGTTPINGWTVAFTFPGDTKVTNAWNATVTQSGKTVTAVNASFNATIAAGSSQSFGFGGSWTSNDANPTSFTLNGSPCVTG